MATFPFLKPLERLLAAHFGAPGEAVAHQIAEELTATIWRESDVRYVVIDGTRGYVCDFRLYENPMIAAAAAQEVARGRVGTVILDRAA